MKNNLHEREKGLLEALGVNISSIETNDEQKKQNRKTAKRSNLDEYVHVL